MPAYDCSVPYVYSSFVTPTLDPRRVSRGPFECIWTTLEITALHGLSTSFLFYPFITFSLSIEISSVACLKTLKRCLLSPSLLAIRDYTTIDSGQIWTGKSQWPWQVLTWQDMSKTKVQCSLHLLHQVPLKVVLMGHLPMKLVVRIQIALVNVVQLYAYTCKFPPKSHSLTTYMNKKIWSQFTGKTDGSPDIKFKLIGRTCVTYCEMWCWYFCVLIRIE